MSADSPRHVRSGGPLTVPSQPPSDRSIIDAVSGFINDVTLSSSSNVDPKDVIQWARFEIADINEPTPEGDSDNDISPLLLILGYGSGVQVWLIPPNGEAQEVLSWRQGCVRVLRILPTPHNADCFAAKRPLIALCDSASPGPSFCSLSFISIRGGEQVKSIKFKNPILDVLANKRSVVVSFPERFAVFDAGTLEDRMAVTTCFPCPCPLGGSLPINPLTLGDRWLAFADKKLNQSKRSSGGCEGEGVTSYTASVLHAAKSLSKGLRGLGESVAQSLSGGRSTSQSPSPPNTDVQQPGVITILDIEQANEEEGQDSEELFDPMVAHFVAHSEAIIALKFDESGLLLVTADRRGHDFHVFRINPHPCGPSLASVHHLYILHRGDTTAKVQDIAVSADSRWAAVSTLRGTTHVFAISPYGGACGVRTHTTPRVVNRLSRFHRSAGLPIHAAAAHKRPSDSPVGAGQWFPNPRLPPYPQPATSGPLAQLRPTANLPTHTITRTSSGRQRLSSLSEDSNSVPLLARARFGLVCGAGGAGGAGAAGGAGGGPGGQARAPPAAPAAALYLMTATGDLLHLQLHPRPLSSLPKEKVCDESPIEVCVEPVGRWPLQRPAAAGDLLAPLPPSNPLLQPLTCRRCADICMSEEERWLSQVEIVTHAGPHRRLWMGPQFVFKTYNCTGSSSSLSEAEAVEVEAARGAARSNPVNMPARPLVPLLVDSGSASSLEVEQSPSDSRRKSLLADPGRAVCDVQLREDLAEAMKEDHGCVSSRVDGAAGAEGVSRTVGPMGTVAQPSAAPPPPPLDADEHTRSNCDEATFRPVVRASAALPAAPPAASPLPTTTTIPVETLAGQAPAPPPASSPLPTTTTIPVETLADQPPTPPPTNPLPLTTTVLIPAELQHDHTDTDIRLECEVTDESASVNDSTQSLPKSNRPPADIQSVTRDRVKKSPTPKDRVSDVRDKKSSKIKSARADDFVDVPMASKEPVLVEVAKSTGKKDVVRKLSDAAKPQNDGDLDFEKLKEIPVMREPIQGMAPAPKERETKSSRLEKSSKKEPDTRESIVVIDDKPTLEVTMSNKKETSPCKTTSVDEEMKTEDQAWDMLLSEPCKPIQKFKVAINENNTEDAKPKSKKGRKGKKSQEEIQLKADEDSFVEIHAIEEKQQPSSGELVSISSPFEDINTTSSYSKGKKSRAAKSVTPDRKEEKDDVEIHVEEWPLVEPVPISSKSKSSKKYDFDSSDIVPQQPNKSTEKVTDKVTDTLKVESAESGSSESSSPVRKESPKSKKSKSCSPNLDGRKSVEKITETEVKDVYVINTITEDFPEIKITRGSKQRKKSPQPVEKKIQETEKEILPEKTGKSWSSIAERKSQEIEVIIEQPVSSWSSITERKTMEKEAEKPVRSITDKKGNEQEVATEKSTKSWSSIADKKTQEIEFLHELPAKPLNSITEKKSRVKEVVKEKSGKSWSCTAENKIREKDIPELQVKSWSSITEKKSQDKEVVNEKPNKSWSSIAERKVQDKEVELPLKSWNSTEKKRQEKEFEKPTESWSSVTEKKRSGIELVPEKPTKSWSSGADPKSQEKDIVAEKPPKSWSSIAASNTSKESAEMVDTQRKSHKAADKSDDEGSSFQEISLQEKLVELLNRTDIMVAECDAPSELSELNFVDEHHSLLHDLPPLEPLDFALDDFKLDVMRDSLIEADDVKETSPICKINIDDILSSIKETTNKAIESSSFNLINLEKVPPKKEQGFSVVENDEIISQEVKIDDEKSEDSKEGELMEKSSDDDVTSPAVSTDSDKEDKKSAGASNVTMPSSKQSIKSKKSRRKKK